jgi:broad specificity phosphatase PhoE
MVTTLYLVRHGETVGSETKRYKGNIDVPLSEKGILQVEAAAAYVRKRLSDPEHSRHLSYLRDIHKSDSDAIANPSVGLSAVYSSGLSRAVKSAEIIGAAYGLIPLIKNDLRERSFGIWEGMSFTDIKERYPAEFEAWAGNPLKYSPMDGESTLQVKERVIAALDGLLAAHNSETIAIVAHGGVNRIILCHVLGMPLEHIFRIEQDFAAINVIEFWDKYPVVKLINGNAHG